MDCDGILVRCDDRAEDVVVGVRGSATTESKNHLVNRCDILGGGLRDEKADR